MAARGGCVVCSAGREIFALAFSVEVGWGERELGEKRGKEPKWPEGGGLIVLLLCMGRLPIDRRGRHHTEALISVWVVRPHGKLRLGAQSLPEGLLARHESERVGRDYHAEDWPVG